MKFIYKVVTLFLSATILLADVTYAKEQPSVKLNSVFHKPCIYRISRVSWIDLMSVVKLEIKQKNSVVIHLAGINDITVINTNNSESLVTEIISEQIKCVKHSS